MPSYEICTVVSSQDTNFQNFCGIMANNESFIGGERSCSLLISNIAESRNAHSVNIGMTRPIPRSLLKTQRLGFGNTIRERKVAAL